MKKLSFSFLVILAISCGMNAQTQVSAQPIATVVIGDTIHYYANKFYFKTGLPLDSFPYYKSPASTATLVTHVGSYFENNEPLDITGLQGYASRHPQSLISVPVHLYLCQADPVTKMPKMPPLDSVVSSVTNSLMTSIGGALAHGTKRITNDFYVLFRNMSVSTSDTANLMRTAGITPTASGNPEFRTSESFGVLRNVGKFYSTTNYTSIGFGAGTDYEFCVAPIVQYTLMVGHDKPWESNPEDTIFCWYQQMIFKSTCSKRISHRMYNLVEFRRRWDNNPPFDHLALTGANLPSDSSGVTWHFLAEDFRNYHLPANSTNGEMIFVTDSASYKQDGVTPDTLCFEGNEFRVRHYGMNMFGGKGKYSVTETFNHCTMACPGVGVAENPLMAQIKVFPTPMTNGILQINGLPIESTITAYNLLGQQVLNVNAAKADLIVDFGSQPQGSYILKINNTLGTKVIRVIKQ